MVDSIGAGYGHVGQSAGTRNAAFWSDVGAGAFNVALTGGTIAAGMTGGSAAASAVSTLGGLVGGSSSSSTSGTSTSDGISAVTDYTNSAIDQSKENTATVAADSAADQQDLFLMQQSINAMTQSFTTLTNCQKAAHDAKMAAVNNVR